MYYKRSRFDRNLSRVKDNLPMVLVVMIALAFFYFVCSYYVEASNNCNGFLVRDAAGMLQCVQNPTVVVPVGR
jgi:hypothetical protein